MMEPKPLSLPHPPYVFGGTTKSAIRRVAARGDGWYGVGVDAAETAAIVGRIAELRPPGESAVEITVGLSPDAVVDDGVVEAFAEAGVDRLVVRPWHQGRDAVAGVAALATRLGIVPAPDH